MHKGFATSVIVIFIALFVLVPVVFFLTSRGSTSDNVMGVFVDGASGNTSGVTINVKSSSGTWVLYSYLCSTKDVCLSSLDAGVELSTTGGGASVTGNAVFIAPDASWKTDSSGYLKTFIKSGWGGAAGSFDVVAVDSPVDVVVNTVQHGGGSYKVVLIPVSDLLVDYVGSVNFSN
jgi:hypothetical protein